MHLSKLYDAERFRKHGIELVNLLADYLVDTQTSNSSKVINWEDPNNEYQFWNNFKASDTKDFFSKIIQRSIQIHRPNYMGHQVAVPAPISALGSLVSGFLNNGMAVYEMGAASTAIEKICIEFICKHLGFNQEASGFLTSGGTLANLTALLSARSKLHPSIWNNGHQEDQKLAIMVSEQAHYCVDRAARIMGLGKTGIIKVPVNDQFQMEPNLLYNCYQDAIENGLTVFAVVGSACSTSTGSYDDLKRVGDFAKKNKLWFHVDGAHGAAVCFSEKYKHLVHGIEFADSVALDCHKMMMTSSVTTALLFKSGKESYRTFSQEAEYLWAEQESEEWYNLGKRTFECTKLMMSLHFFGIIHLHGKQVLEEYVDTVHDNAISFSQMILRDDQFELAIPPKSNIVCFRFIGTKIEKEDLNKINKNIRKKLLKNGTFYIVETMLNNIVYLRTTLMNPFTTKSNLQNLLTTIKQIQNQNLLSN